jgi:hypothetical protein
LSKCLENRPVVWLDHQNFHEITTLLDKSWQITQFFLVNPPFLLMNLHHFCRGDPVFRQAQAWFQEGLARLNILQPLGFRWIFTSYWGTTN